MRLGPCLEVHAHVTSVKDYGTGQDSACVVRQAIGRTHDGVAYGVGR